VLFIRYLIKLELSSLSLRGRIVRKLFWKRTTKFIVEHLGGSSFCHSLLIRNRIATSFVVKHIHPVSLSDGLPSRLHAGTNVVIDRIPSLPSDTRLSTSVLPECSRKESIRTWCRRDDASCLSRVDVSLRDRPRHRCRHTSHGFLSRLPRVPSRNSPNAPPSNHGYRRNRSTFGCAIEFALQLVGRHTNHLLVCRPNQKGWIIFQFTRQKVLNACARAR